MSRARRLLAGAFATRDAANERAAAKALAKLTPAERERHDAWVAHTAAVTEALGAGRPIEELGDPRLIGRVLFGPAGEYVAGMTKLDKKRQTIEDPAAWEAQMRAERAARDEARAPYLAPERSPVRIARVATQGKTQVEEVADRLAADDGLGARRIGAPAPLDEDLALHLLAGAAVDPERTLGIARAVAIEKRDGSGDDGSMRILASVRGVHLLAAPGSPPLDGDVGREPLRLPEGPPEGIVVDVLQWDAIAKVVHPVRQHRPPLPSPFPYLPLTPQELRRADLEIVGVAPADAYAAQVTHGRPFDLMGRTSMKSGVRRTGGGPDLPCADGKPRERMAGGHHVVVAYRDRPAYADGRTRFDAYAETELKAHLRRGLDLRLPVPKPAGRLERTVDRVSDVVDFFTGDMGVEDGFVPPRYCWPPQP